MAEEAFIRSQERERARGHVLTAVVRMEASRPCLTRGLTQGLTRALR
jgi:hypothetical protein